MECAEWELGMEGTQANPLHQAVVLLVPAGAPFLLNWGSWEAGQVLVSKWGLPMVKRSGRCQDGQRGLGGRGKTVGFLALKPPLLGQGLAHAGAAEAVPTRGSALGGFPPLTWGHGCWKPHWPCKGPILSTTACWSPCWCSAGLVPLCIAACLGKTASDAFLC